MTELQKNELTGSTSTKQTTESSSRQTGRRSAEEAGQTREKILRAAIGQFSEHGFHVTSLRDIAAEAGVTHGIIRHHFGSKSGIWEKSAERIFTHYAEWLMPFLAVDDPSLPPAERFMKLVKAFITLTLDHPEYTRFIVQEMRQDSERSRYCYDHFLPMHKASGLLFEQVKDVLPGLHRFSNDTFYYTLMSLSGYHIINPVLSTGVDTSSEQGKLALTELILAILFPTDS